MVSAFSRAMWSVTSVRITITRDEIEVLAIFGRVDPNCDQFDFVFEGLKERVYVDRYETWIEDVYKVVTYKRTGDEFYRQHDLLKQKKTRWMTREERKKLVRKPVGG